MSPQAPGGPPQNQSLLELIYAIKGLAQTIDFMHTDLRHRIEAEARDNNKELDKIADLVGRNGQGLSVLPITVSDRIEKMLNALREANEKKIDGLIEEVRSIVDDLHIRLNRQVQIRRASSLSDVSDGVVEASAQEEISVRREITGRIEVHQDGSVNVTLSGKAFAWFSKWGKRIAIALATGGGIAAAVREIYHYISN